MTKIKPCFVGALQSLSCTQSAHSACDSGKVYLAIHPRLAKCSRVDGNSTSGLATFSCGKSFPSHRANYYSRPALCSVYQLHNSSGFILPIESLVSSMHVCKPINQSFEVMHVCFLVPRGPMHQTRSPTVPKPTCFRISSRDPEATMQTLVVTFKSILLWPRVRQQGPYQIYLWYPDSSMTVTDGSP